MAAEEHDKKSLAEELIEESEKPLTMKDRLVGLILAVGFAGLGVCMWLWPAFLSVDTSEATGRTVKKFGWIMEAIWSRPVGAVAILLALLILYGSLTKKSAEPDKA